MTATRETTAAAPLAPIVKAINFQPNSAPVPAGYTKDIGEAYNDTRGFGWVREDNFNTPLDIQLNTRDRNQSGIDQRLDTLIHMQYPASNPGPAVKTNAAWQCLLSNGTYNVTVSVGDAGNAIDSSHQINLEDQLTISSFVPTATKKFFVTTLLIDVKHGKLTIDAKGGTNTKLNYVEIAVGNRPSIRKTNPTDSETNVPTNISITADLNLLIGGGGINSSTLTPATVKLIDTSTNTQVNAPPTTTGGRDAIILTPTASLKPNTKYLFQVTEGLKDTTGNLFLPYSISFKTGSSSQPPNGPIAFDRVQLTNVPAKPYTTVVIGPDNKLYASTLVGEILRFPINADGTVGTPQTITSLQNANGGNRTIIGMVFDPASNASNLILWVTNNWNGTGEVPDWSGKITRLSGANLETVQDYVIGLPRSIRDHMTNSITFNPNKPNESKILYVLQGSNTAMGGKPDVWGDRLERLLTAAVLRVDLSKISSPPLNVKTEEGGTYNPFASGAAVTIFASGVRNAYDLIWHSNGQLYVPTNGSAASGSTPGTPSPLPSACQNRIDKATNGNYTGPSVPSRNNVGDQHDYLFRVVQGGYYGHPNPKRCEWVMNGGNPTGGADPAQVVEYPVGTQPDRNWRGFAFDFGAHFSPNGIVEYKNNAFGGQLKGKMLVIRYSANKDIIVLTPGGSNLDIVASQTDITGLGLTRFDPSPLDLVENPSNGQLYVAQLNEETGSGTISLLKPRLT